MPLQQINGEENRCIGMPGAPMIGYGDGIPAVGIRRNALRLLRPTRAKRRASRQKAYPCIPRQQSGVDSRASRPVFSTS